MNILYLPIPEPFSSDIKTFGKATLYPKDVVEYVEDPHITLLYGITSGDVNDIKRRIGDFLPIRVMFGQTSMFIADDYRPTDVVKIDIHSMTLKNLRKLVDDMAKNAHYKVFIPHVTVAYVEPFTAIQYVGENPVAGKKFVSNYLMFSNGIEKYKIYCDGSLEKLNV